jgi:alkanesulfonate monooxygenase SsuD/methylene tetrahydromethanopterin reductase-like flavin-dependent oxidoreductase (luciferase family)
MRELWASDAPTFKGRYVAFAGAHCRPQPVNKSVPIIVGGHSEPAARRAGRLGDGFFPARGAPADLIAIARQAAQAAGRDPAKLEITVSLPDDLGELEALHRLGVTRVLVPATGGAGLPARIGGPEELATWRPVIERYATV